MSIFAFLRAGKTCLGGDYAPLFVPGMHLQSANATLPSAENPPVSSGQARQTDTLVPLVTGPYVFSGQGVHSSFPMKLRNESTAGFGTAQSRSVRNIKKRVAHGTLSLPPQLKIGTRTLTPCTFLHHMGCTQRWSQILFPSDTLDCTRKR